MCVYACVLWWEWEWGGESQGEGEACGKERDAIRSDPERRALQSAERQLWEGSPFTLSLFLSPELSFLIGQSS